MYRLAANKLTKIVFTLEEDALLYEDSVIAQMIQSGMDMVRIEIITSHYNVFTSLISKLYNAASDTGSVISVFLEIPSSYRVALGSGDLNVEKGEIVLLVIGEGEVPVVDFDYKDYLRLNFVGASITIGEFIVFGDEVRGEILKFTEGWVLVKILDTGTVYNKSRVKIQDNCKLTDILQARQQQNIEFACNSNVDFIAFSFSNNYVQELETIKKSLKNNSKIIFRIEEYIDVSILDQIISLTDGVLVARYPMGAEMPIEKICTYQKEIVRRCNEMAKPVLISGHVLGSLRSLPYPLRADACDVYNGVIDGVDGFVLSSGVVGESCWKNTIEMLKNILSTAEAEIDHVSCFNKIWMNSKPGIKESLASSAVKTAIELSASYIIVLVETGEMARLLAKYRPPTPIICISPNRLMSQQTLIHRGSIPIIEDVREIEKTIAWATQNLSGTVVTVTDSDKSTQGIAVTVVQSNK
jgi:pyruvate kinase